MRYLGIDYGTKKIGVTISDEEGSFAFPHGVIPSDTAALDAIAKICSEKGVGAVVLGRSRNYAGQENPVMANVKNFEKALRERTSLPIEYEDEVLTTAQAARDVGKNENTDAAAAALILGNFLSRLHAN